MGKIRHLSLIFCAFFSLALAACSGSSTMSPEEQKAYDDFWAKSSLHIKPSGSTDGSSIVADDQPTKQIMVSGTVQIPGYTSGAIVLEVRQAEACDKGYCPVEGVAPLASTVLNNTGFFSLIVPSKGQKTSLVASAPGKTGLLYLGELKSKMDGIVLNLK